ncbi:hypothetical protein UAJ10_12620 [Nitrospirillum sp. BR 11164]|uniref:hypothetical protein n=1 Tax=Nitrospirillum sp. BR 11164 TaxID=3104324 RepID=UPI002AFF7319|nr:hypothetical protein [Nitrospirillum sp. BR 11164]MEA1649855.1 hypothetical protein [Nitrospirillum sp. BR 11164]
MSGFELSDFKPFEESDFLTDDQMIATYLELCAQDADLKVLRLAVAEVVKVLRLRQA